MSAAADPALDEDQPRTIEQPCSKCKSGIEVRINGLYFRQKRREANVTLSQAARACGVSCQHLSRMERGDKPFPKGYAEICERFFARRMRAGPE